MHIGLAFPHAPQTKVLCNDENYDRALFSYISSKQPSQLINSQPWISR